MRSLLFQPLSTRTARAARAVFNVENLYLTIGDRLDVLLGDLNLDDLDAFGEKPPSALAFLAMVTLFQFAENLPDHQAADAVRTRLDWKYALHLPLDYPGIDVSALSEFRQRLRLNKAGQVVFRQMLTRLEDLGLWGSGNKRRVDVVGVLTAVDDLSRTEAVVAAMNQALETLASCQSEWLRTISLPHWYERYGQSSWDQHLPSPGQKPDIVMQTVGTDISYLLKAIAEADVPDIARLAEVQALRMLWHRRYVPGDA